MAGLVVQHNLSAINANNRMNANVTGLKKATEKLSSGYQINRAGDNAAGLAISEKMRSQIRGLSQAVKNANDGISLIQTAEGGLNETHSILQRMRELAVQSANGTYQDDTDREAIQLEVDALKSEIDRISTATEYNGMQLLDGSLSGAGSGNTSYGAKYGVTTADLGGTTVSVTANIAGVKLTAKADGANVGCENAVWSKDGKELTLNLAKNTAYTDEQINDLIKNAAYNKDAAGQEQVPATIGYSSKAGVIAVAEADINLAGNGTVAGIRATSDDTDIVTLVGDTANGLHGSSDTIKITANTYGSYAVDKTILKSITIKTDAEAGKEKMDITAADDGDTAELHLCTGKYYTEKDIEDLIRKEGYDVTVSLTDAKNTDGDADGKVYFNSRSATGVEVALTDGAGVGKSVINGTGEGLTFQIGANGVKDQRVTLTVDDMSSSAIGVANADVSTQGAANKAIEMVDKAVKTVSMQRAALGAMQNRLEYTVNNLTTTNENLTNAESQIRDTDMATEMINYTKYNILQQASQAMLAQANQQPQAVLQLLG